MSEKNAGLIVAHSHRLEDLTALVVELTKVAPLPPLASECVLVQSNGIAQWLQRHLAEAIGIAAMLDVTLPARFQWQAYRAVLGNDLPRYSPFDKERLTWRLLRLLPEHLHEPEFAALARYVEDDTEQRKLYQLSERLADLYDQYQMYRADWLADWAAGGAIMAAGENAWQPKLWRIVLADVGDQGLSDRAALHRRFVQAAQQLTPSQRPSGLPPRVVVFGISSLPQQMIEVLDALSHCCQVILCVHNPCKHFWMDSIDGRDVLREITRKRQQRKPGQAELVLANLHTETHPLLASWGKQGGDYIRMLDAFDATEQRARDFPSLRFDLFDDAEEATTSQLRQLQSDVLHLRSVQEAQPYWEQLAEDQSLRFMSCHSPQREVEVLHDQLLALFAQDRGLKPSDIIVMVPDIDGYAPHIHAVFGRYPREDKRRIPYTIADQGMRHRHPLLMTLEYVLQLNVQRLKASEMLDILQVEAVQQRFGLSSEDVEQLQQWLRDAGVRWALHEQHREQLGLPGAQGRNTWWFGLRRMLLGYAVGFVDGFESEWQGFEAYPEVGGLEANAVGALQQLVRVLDDVLQHSTVAQTPQQWTQYLLDVMQRLFASDDDHEALLLSRLRSQLEAWLDAVDAAEYDAPLPLSVVVESWLSKVDEHQLNQRFLAGSVNFATLMPMRAIPFKGVFLLGMNDGEYPRQRKPFDFDLMMHDHRPGDRSRREDDRYLFLEALLSARQWFYLSWCGRSIKDNTEKPPSVLVGQLLEHLQQLGQKAAIEQHFLQPFHPRYFSDAADAQHYFSYAHEWQAIHTTTLAPSNSATSLPAWLPESPVTIRQLYHCFMEPAKWLMQQRFQCFLPEARVDSDDDELFRFNGLQRWQFTQALSEPLLEALQRGVESEAWQQQLDALILRWQRQGALSVGAAGMEQQQQLREAGQAFWAQAQPWAARYPEWLAPQDVLFGSNGQLQVRETFRGVQRSATDKLIRIKLSASRLADSNGSLRLAKLAETWLEHLLLNSQQPCQTVVLSVEKEIVLPALTQTNAQAAMERLSHWASVALTQPLPVHFELVLAGWQSLLKKGLAEVVEASERPYLNAVAETLYSQGDRHLNVAPLAVSAAYLGRFYPHWETLVAAGEQNDFITEVYLPMLSALAEGEAQ
ncbi:exodeoxyribonuclease V subunit gamma [Pseudidiomarina sediminum]|uniref:RecBCD enzyme subunit RecC n=1 Tax=Pseudidiomarina sediminum TaxID=431675 RepID=A0A432Z2I2_9GAMM|nr:exodeoxyribonuclease V subunit gamma [Pseudidiomarina sediminum]RUO72085.1 exodeoxyribonuclease V subunit gamma [Pseudidiomarina sediminum]